MSNRKKIIAGVAGVCALFFGFVAVRIGAQPNDDSVKLVAIQGGTEAKIGKEAYKDAYPLQYNSFMKNNEETPSPTGYGGSMEGNSHLEHQPEMLENFKGYKFALQYDDDRGHTYAGYDLLHTKRLPGQKGSCLQCKGSYVYDVYFKEGGWAYASKPFDEVAAPITDDEWFGCSTCHDPDTMQLRVYQQGFVEAMARRGVDVNAAPHNDMRAYVCAQCHTEYYFTAEDGRVNHPYDNGLKGDWMHPDSKTMMLKAQHPEFETWATSVHADAGVTCVDCHMPYMRDGGKKYTSHWMSSPLKYTKEACLKCHDESEETLVARVKTIHDNTFKLQRIAGQSVAKAHLTVKAAMDAGVPDASLEDARAKLREAQWYWDWVAAENGMGFHNPDKIMRTLGLSIDLAHQAVESAQAAQYGIKPI